jgi:hypothetical protein
MIRFRSFFGAAALVATAGKLGASISADEVGGSNSFPIYNVELPADYRQWQVISVAHEAGSLNDIRVILGNGIATKAFQTGAKPFPDGAKIARVAWTLVPSVRNNAIFGRPQSFVAGEPTNVQIEVKDSRRYGSTGGWGYGQFENGKANTNAALMGTCFACHSKLSASDDFIFTSYAR